MTCRLTGTDLAAIVRLLAVVWLGMAFVVLLRELAGSVTVRDWQYAALDDLVSTTLRIWLPWVIFSPVVVMGIKRFLFLPGQVRLSLLIHLCLVAGFVLVHLAVLAYHYQFFEDDENPDMLVYAGWEHMGHFIVADPLVLTDVVIYGLFLARFNFVSYVGMVREKEQQTSRLEAHLVASKLHALQMQVHPHFLFNTLNSISVLIRKRETATAEEMIHRLSEFFRTTLEQGAGHLVTLEAELEALDNYLAIEQQRFQDRLRIEKHIDPQALSAQVPALVLQPLVENSIKHGVSVSDRPVRIEIRCRWLGDRVLMEILDDGPGPAKQHRGSREGTGLANVRARLQQLYPRVHVFDLGARAGRGTRVSIEIPVTAGRTGSFVSGSG